MVGLLVISFLSRVFLVVVLVLVVLVGKESEWLLFSLFFGSA